MVTFIIFAIISTTVIIAQNIVDILGIISAYFGLDVGSIFAIAAGITVVVNYLKVTPPFSNFVQGNVILIITFVLSAIVSAITLWGNLIQIIVATIVIAVLSIGGWATAKILAHKIGTNPTNKSGGLKK